MASSQQINAWNEQWRSSPQYRSILASVGINPNSPFRLSDQQRKQVQRTIQQQMGVQFPKGVEIDPAGNMNENEGFGKQAKKWGPVVGGAALAAFGIPGVMPGLIGGAGGAAGAMPAAWGFETAGLTGPGAAGMLGTGTAAGTGAAVKGGLFSTLGKFFGSPGGAQLTDLAGNLVGAGLQSRAANRGMDLQSQYNQQALEFLKQQDARDYAEYLKERERMWGLENEDRTRAEEDRQLRLLREREREGRLTPFRQGAERGYQTLSSLLFNPNQPMAQTAPVSRATTRRSLADLVR
jgi:hypothetical protein